MSQRHQIEVAHRLGKAFGHEWALQTSPFWDIDEMPTVLEKERAAVVAYERETGQYRPRGVWPQFEEGQPVSHVSKTGRTRWTVAVDGTVTVKITRPNGILGWFEELDTLFEVRALLKRYEFEIKKHAAGEDESSRRAIGCLFNPEWEGNVKPWWRYREDIRGLLQRWAAPTVVLRATIDPKGGISGSSVHRGTCLRHVEALRAVLLVLCDSKEVDRVLLPAYRQAPLGDYDQALLEATDALEKVRKGFPPAYEPKAGDRVEQNLVAFRAGTVMDFRLEDGDPRMSVQWDIDGQSMWVSLTELRPEQSTLFHELETNVSRIEALQRIARFDE